MAENTMNAVYLERMQVLHNRKIPIPQLTAPDDVLIRLGSIGVCGSDCHYYEYGKIGSFIVTAPIILGHECAGTVVEVGAKVKELQPGDRVAVEPGYPCRRCRRCHEGRYNICEGGITFMGTPGQGDGAFREYLTWPSDFLYKLPEGLSLEDGAMIEPLAVGVHACNRGKVRPGQSVIVLGAGPIGLLTAQTALAYGASPVVATDIIPSRLERAQKLGLTALDSSSNDYLDVVKDITDGGSDVVIETAGTVATTKEATTLVRTGGTMVLVGMMPEEEVTLPVSDMISREYDLQTVFRYANCYRTAITLVKAGHIKLAPLRTQEFSLAEVERALLTVINNKAEACKVMIKA